MGSAPLGLEQCGLFQRVRGLTGPSLGIDEETLDVEQAQEHLTGLMLLKEREKRHVLGHRSRVPVTILPTLGH